MNKITDLELLNSIGILYENKVVIYGVGDFGKRAANILENLGINDFVFCDSNVKKWGQKCYDEDHKIISLIELGTLSALNTIVVIIAMEKMTCVEEVLSTLQYCNISNAKCYTYFALKYTVEFHINDSRIPVKFKERFSLSKNAYLNQFKYHIVNRALNSIYEVLWKKAIMVFQPSKVGSTSVCASLDHYNIPRAHIHYIAEFRNIIGNMIEEFDSIKTGIKQLQQAEDVKIITLVREPISRDISSYFQAFWEFVIIEEQREDIQRGIMEYLDTYSGFEGIGWQFAWFNNEIKKIFGIDIYKYNFDKEKGYSVIQSGNVEILLIKMEKLNDCEDVIGEFVGVKDFHLFRENVAESKLYKYAYQEIKSNIRIPRHIIERYYNGNSCMDHFYTQQEKAKFLERYKIDM